MVCHCDYCVRGRKTRQEVRQSAGTPETEIPKYGVKKRRKKKHVHDYRRTLLNQREVDRYSRNKSGDGWIRRKVVVYDYAEFCEGCGHRWIRRGY